MCTFLKFNDPEDNKSKFSTDKIAGSAAVLFSGGQDSTTCLAWAIKKFERVIAIGFDYGQKHVQELAQAREIAKEMQVPFRVFKLPIFTRSSLLENNGKNNNENHHLHEHLPASFTAGRNAIFLSIAASYASDQGIANIVTGVCETDYSGYPDCRADFIQSQQETLSLALDTMIKIHTPLMFLTKAQTWGLAYEIGDEKLVELIRTKTMTDYNGNMTMNEWGMGNLDNPASMLRAKGYYEALSAGMIPVPN